MYKIVICDDDPDYIKELEEIILTCNDDKRRIRFLEYDSGQGMLDGMPEDVDVVFLDVKMEGLNGNQIAVMLQKNGYSGVLVQCSGIFIPTTETVKISPYRFLLKHAPPEKVREEVGEILEEADRQKACYLMEASYQREKVLVKTADVVYITHHRKGSVLHLNKAKREKYSEGNLITPLHFEELLDMLHPVGFVWPHNSHLINLRYVTNYSLNHETVELEGKFFPIARKSVDQFSKQLIQYMNQKYKKKL